MREHLKAFYLEYVNAFITVQAMSDYKHMSEADTQTCIDMGRRIHEDDVARTTTLTAQLGETVRIPEGQVVLKVESELFGYVAFYYGKRHELRAPNLYAAKQSAVRYFKAPRSKEHMVTVMLAERADGTEVAHSTGSL